MANERIRKSYEGGAAATTLAADISAGSSSLTVAGGSTYPTGADGPFVISVDRNTVNEEKMLISSRASSVFTILERGYDGTSAVSHTSGARVEHVLDAYSIDQANQLANVGVDAGDLPYWDGTTWVRRAVSTNGLPLVTAGGVPSWAQVGNAGISAVSPEKVTRRGCKVTCTTQNVTGSELLVFDTESYDSDGFHVAASTDINIPAGLAGLYAITATVVGPAGWANNNLKRAMIYHVDDNIGYNLPSVALAVNTVSTITIIRPLAVGDTLEIQVTDAGGDYSATLELYLLGA